MPSVTSFRFLSKKGTGSSDEANLFFCLMCFLQAAKKTADKSKTILNNIERWQKVCGLDLVTW